MKPVLTIKDLIRRAETFCTFMSKENHEKVCKGNCIGQQG